MLISFIENRTNLFVYHYLTNNMRTSEPKFKVGDTIYWYCSEDDSVHNAKVLFVNFAKAGDYYIEVNYEVETECKGEKHTLFIDDCDAMEMDLSV